MPLPPIQSCNAPDNEVPNRPAIRFALRSQDHSSAKFVFQSQPPYLAQVGKTVVQKPLCKTVRSQLKKEYFSRSDVKRLAQRGSSIVPAMTACLSDKDPNIRYHAVLVISELGLKAKSAFSKLVLLLKDPAKQSIRATAADALSQIGDKRAVPALIGVMNNTKLEGYVRSSAARALSMIKDKRAIAPLIAILKKGDIGVGDEAEKALERFKDKKAKAALRSHRRRGFRPHWFIAGGVGGLLSAANVFHGLSKKTLHIPPHPDDYGKYDDVSTVPFSKKDGVDVGVGSVFFDIGYKYQSYFGLKNRFSLFFFESLAGYPPLIRQRYESGQNAFTYLVPAFAISNTVLADLSYTYYSNEKVGFPWFAIGLEVGLSVTLIGYEYGWDRYAKRQWGGVRCGGGIGPQVGVYVKAGGLKIGVSFDILHSGFYMARTYFSIQYPFGFEKE